ncbi:MAG: hypothetical protein GX270_15875 [Clostridiaceae bacterium]|nr:hypothetical protein [Clostridiaceae bacterium]
MKRKFEGKEISLPSKEWDEKVSMSRWLSSDVILSALTKEHKVKAVIHPFYCACEYRIKLNLFTFGKIKVKLPFTVIAPPASVDCKGYTGDVQVLIDDYKKKKGLFLLLNLEKEDTLNISENCAAIGKTLPSCVFLNSFEKFEDYLTKLRSSYRRRVKIALEKGQNLKVKKIDNMDFDNEIYELYLQVLKQSQFPLETLPITFFQLSNCNIDVFYYENKPVAFVMYYIDDGFMSFVLGGMNYNFRDVFDLYYNMLLHMLMIGIDNKVNAIDFGQTTEKTKCRLGCEIDERYMAAFSGNRFITKLLCRFAHLLEYNQEIIKNNVFK